MNILLWDFDGTLASRDGMWTGTLVAVANRLLPEQPVTSDVLRPFLQTGFPWHRPECVHPDQTSDEWWAALNPVFVQAYRGAGIEASLAHKLAGQVRAAYLEKNHWRVFDDVLPCLAALQKRGWNHYVLSNHVPELPELVQALGLAPFFDEVVTSARSGYEKPHPEAFQVLLRRFPRSSIIWMIGDSLAADVAGAENLGIPAILVRKRQDGARCYCDSLAALEGVLSAQPCSGTIAALPPRSL